MGWSDAVSQWGSTAEEQARAWPCDGLVEGPQVELFRAIDVAAPQAVVFRWLCQLRAAPYSYDKLDNLGRRSPQELTPGLEQLETRSARGSSSSWSGGRLAAAPLDGWNGRSCLPAT